MRVFVFYVIKSEVGVSLVYLLYVKEDLIRNILNQIKSTHYENH